MTMENESEDPIADLGDSIDGILVEGADTGTRPKPGAGTAARAVHPNQDVVYRVPVTVQVMLGHVKLPVAEIMKLSQGAVVALDRRLGEPVDLLVNGCLIARGEIVVVDEVSKRLGISLTEIVDASRAA